MAARLATMPRGSAYQLAKRLGLVSSYIYRKLKPQNDGPLTVAQAGIIRAFFENPDAEFEPADMAGTPPHAPSGPARQRIPVYGYAAAGGEDLVAMNDGEVLDWIELPMGLALGPGEWFAVHPVGSSMEPRIFSSDLLLVRRKHPPMRGKDVLVEFTDGTGVIKTYKGQRDGRVFVEQWNEHKGLDYDATKVKALHGGVIKI